MSLTRLAVRGSCRAGGQRLGDRVERADVFCAPSILIAGQDLVDDEATRHGVVAKLRVEANVAVAANDSRYTLRAQDGTLRHTSPDLKMYHSQIEQFVAQAGQDPSFTTTLINASLGVAVIGGFIHISLANYAKDCLSGSAKQIDAMSNSLRTILIDATLIDAYKNFDCDNCKKQWPVSGLCLRVWTVAYRAWVQQNQFRA